MKQAYDELVSFLVSIAKEPRLLSMALDRAEPVFALTRKPEFPLRPWHELDANGVGSVIGRTAGVLGAFCDVTFVSLTEPFPKPTWMSVGAYRCHALPAVVASIGDDNTLSSVLYNRFRPRIEKALGPDSSRELWGRVWRCLLDTRWYEQGALRSIPGTCLFNFFGLIAAGDLEGSSDMLPLIKHLPSCFPLGKKEDDANVWLVLTA